MFHYLSSIEPQRHEQIIIIKKEEEEEERRLFQSLNEDAADAPNLLLLRKRFQLLFSFFFFLLFSGEITWEYNQPPKPSKRRQYDDFKVVLMAQLVLLFHCVVLVLCFRISHPFSLLCPSTQ